MRYGVHYWVVKKDAPHQEFKNAACFSYIWGKHQDEIKFLCYWEDNTPSGESLTKEIIDFYLRFIRRILRKTGCAKWTARKIEKDKQIMFRLNTEGLKDKQCLFYLTWFRYIQEMPNFLVHFFNRKEAGDTDDVLFKKFQDIHYECLAGKISGCYTNSNHGLMLKDNYGSES